MRLKLGCLSLANRCHHQLITLFYKVVCTPDLDYLRQLFTIPENDAVVSKSMRLPPWIVASKSPRTEAWNTSFTVEGQRLANRLSIISFDINRLQELKEWVHNILLQAEIDAWRLRVDREGFCPQLEFMSIPSPQLQLYEAAFTPPLVSTYTSHRGSLHPDLMSRSTLHTLHFTIAVIIHRQHTLLHSPHVKLLLIHFNLPWLPGAVIEWSILALLKYKMFLV